jgi:hypothetical protein
MTRLTIGACIVTGKIESYFQSEEEEKRGALISNTVVLVSAASAV